MLSASTFDQKTAQIIFLEEHILLHDVEKRLRRVLSLGMIAGVSILQAAPIHFPSGPQYSSPLATRILALKGQKPLKKVNIMHI